MQRESLQIARNILEYKTSLTSGIKVLKWVNRFVKSFANEISCDPLICESHDWLEMQMKLQMKQKRWKGVETNARETKFHNTFPSAIDVVSNRISFNKNYCNSSEILVEQEKETQ